MLLLIIAPLSVPAGDLTDLSGSIMVIDNSRQFDNLNPLAKTVYYLGDMNCHQLKNRSFFLNDNQMPFCARDIGIFSGIFIGAITALIMILPTKWYWLIIGFLPIAVDGIMQEVTAYESSNSLRFVTGALAGAVGALFLCIFIAMPIKEKNDESETKPITEN